MGRANLRFAGLVVGAMVLATVWIAGLHHLPVRDHDGIVVPSWVQVPAIAVLAVLVDVLPRAVRRTWRRPSALLGVVREVARERWPASYVRYGLAVLAVCYLVSTTFRNLKSWVPFVNPRQWDDELDSMDRALWLGHDPATVLHDLLGTGVAAHVLSFVYVSWLFLVPATLVVAVLWSRRVTASAWYITALALDWALGLVAHYLLPSLGPVYADPARFADLPATTVSHLQAEMLDDRVALVADPWATGAVEPIAAFASLHVALVVTMVLMAHLLRLPRWVVWSGWAYLALTTLATLYLGWHYSVDDIGGAAIGSVSVWIAAKATGQPMSLGVRRVRARERDEADQPSASLSNPA